MARVGLRSGARAGATAGALVLVLLGALLAGCGDDGDEPDEASETADEAAPAPEEGGDAGGDLAAESEQVFAELAGGGDDPGCAAAVAVEGEAVWSGAWGLADVDAEEPITGDTVFDVGSTSKLFTATLVLLLDEQGELDLDAPVSEAVDGLPDWGDEVTLAQLLLHTAGVPDYVELLADEGYEDADTTTTDDALELLAEEELDFVPGERFAYSNSGYLLAAEAVEGATGRPFAEAMATELFAPYDLAAEVDPVTDDPAKATSYEEDGDGWVVADSLWEQVGDGAVQTTPSELVRWASELWDPQIGEDLLTTRLEGAVEDEESEGAYGYGVVIVDDPDLGQVLSHSGAWAGFLSDLVVLPSDEVAVAVTCNTPDLLDPSDAALDLAHIWRP